MSHKCDFSCNHDGEPATPPAMNAANPTAKPKCGCTRCLNESGETVEMFAGMHVPIAGTRMVLCATCGNKRCPHAADHRHACTDSNEPGQPGSNYADCAAPVRQGSATSGEAAVCTDAMLRAAMKAAVAGGIVPKWMIGEESYLLHWNGMKVCIEAALAAKAEQSNSAGSAPYRVAEFWSSANPDKKVRMLAEGDDIEQWGKHGDFIRWVDAPVAERAAPASVPREALQAALKSAELGMGSYGRNYDGNTLGHAIEELLAAPEVAQPAAQGVTDQAADDPVVEANRQLLLDRSRIGISKYGVTLASSGLSRTQLAQHALEEALDLANYLQGIIQTDTAQQAAPEAPATQQAGKGE
jgi:hypothetical protein